MSPLWCHKGQWNLINTSPRLHPQPGVFSTLWDRPAAALFSPPSNHEEAPTKRQYQTAAVTECFFPQEAVNSRGLNMQKNSFMDKWLFEAAPLGSGIKNQDMEMDELWIL